MNPITKRKTWLNSLEVGSKVVRMLAGTIPIYMGVTRIDKEKGRIYCAAWEFLLSTGAEVDGDLGWDGVTLTGSYLREATDEELENKFKERSYEDTTQAKNQDSQLPTL